MWHMIVSREGSCDTHCRVSTDRCVEPRLQIARCLVVRHIELEETCVRNRQRCFWPDPKPHLCTSITTVWNPKCCPTPKTHLDRALLSSTHRWQCATSIEPRDTSDKAQQHR